MTLPNPIAVLALLAALGAGPAIAQRTPVPIIDHPKVPVATSSGKSLEAGQVKQAILEATRLRNWQVGEEPGGTMLASRSWNQHSIRVEISYAGDSYSLKYRDSVNMNYSARGDNDSRPNYYSSLRNAPRPTGRTIHPFYNQYVQELKDAIRVELLKL